MDAVGSLGTEVVNQGTHRSRTPQTVQRLPHLTRTLLPHHQPGKAPI